MDGASLYPFRIPAACKAVELTHPAVGKSLLRMEELGIVREMTGRRHKRLYVCDAYLKTLSEGMETG